jgi:agmatinase
MAYDEFLNRNFVGVYNDFDSSDIVIVGAPFDGTVSFRPGTRFAPQVMRIESVGLETYSPYQDRDLTDYKYHDMGDLNLPFGRVEYSMNMIYENVSKIVKAGKKPIMVGGEHLCTLPSFKAVHEKYPDICVIHFDAHTDLREEFITAELSHATVLRKVWDITGDGRIFQFGIRSGGREEFYWAAEGHTFLNKYDFTGLDKAVQAIGSRPVYFTLDLDVLDPSLMCGTGTTEGGGVTFKELMDAILSMRGLNIAAADIVELAPHYDPSGASTAAACKLLREIMLLIAEE